MFAKAEWFQKRKYGGWGLTPKTWQGWLYVATFVVVLAIFHAMPFWSDTAKTIFTAIWAIVLGVDVLRIMATLKGDEMEKINEAIAERNAAWAMVTVLAIGIIYEVISAGGKEEIAINPFLIATLVVGFLAKGISYFVLEKK